MNVKAGMSVASVCFAKAHNTVHDVAFAAVSAELRTWSLSLAVNNNEIEMSFSDV